MKVYENQGPAQLQASKSLDKKKGVDGEFQKIMDQMELQTDKQAPLQKPGEPGPIVDGIQIIREPEKIGEATISHGREQVAEELQQVLDLVDFYAAKLADSSQPVRGMSPLVNHLEERVKTLENLAQDAGLPQKLGDILSDTVITIGTEIAKFKRGDYS